jgi:predicted site-specific integrase-resolvase
MSGTPVEVVVTSQDRLSRSGRGFQLIRWIIKLYGGEIIILDKKVKTEKFDTTKLKSNSSI